MIYFDNAATTYPKPNVVIKAFNESLIRYGGNPGRSGHKMSINSAKVIYNLREKAAEFFGLSDCDRVVLTKNCTEALNTAIFGCLKNRGNVIVSHMEHNSVMRPLHFLKTNGFCDYKIAKTSFENHDNTVREFEKLIDSETKMIICSHASNVTGKIAPIDKIAMLCKAKNIIFCVDAAQTAGIIDINMEKQGIDILCCPGHKGLFGPTGTGLLLINKNIELSPIIFGGTGSSSMNLEMPEFLPDYLESGTVNIPGAVALYSGIDYINKIGIDKIHRQEVNLASRFYNNIADFSNIQLYSLAPTLNSSVATISFNVKRKSCTDVCEHLDKKGIAVRGGLHCSPMAHKFIGTEKNGTVRASFSIFNTTREIDYVCDVIKGIKG